MGIPLLTDPTILQRADDEHWMQLALEQAHEAARIGEVPVGAVVVLGEDCLAIAHNQPITALDPTAHAEIVALRRAAQALGNYRLTGATLYVTVEPCAMCVGALVHARIKRLVYGTPEPKTGAVESAVRLLDEPCFNHRPEVCGGLHSDTARAQMQQFFAARR